MAGELLNVLHAYGQHVPQELLVLGPPPPLMDLPSLGGDKDIDGKGGDGGGARGCHHLQNDGDHRGRDPLRSNMSLEEEEDDDSYGTPAGTPDSMATV